MRLIRTVAGSLVASAMLPGAAVAQSASSFPLGDVSLADSRWLDNQDRTLSYLLFVDLDRLLYTFRDNHGLDTLGAEPMSGWEAPDFPFRTHSQGHFLTAWSQCYAILSNEECRDRAAYLVSELAKCQANNEEAGFSPGYLAGFPESEFDKLENRTLDNGNVPYYSVHKTMAGLLDVHRLTGDETALDVLLSMASWVDARTGALSESQMQEMMQTEYGGMNDILALLYAETSDDRWLAVSQRFDHHAVLDPLAADRDELAGLHANTQVQKLVGVINQYLATGTTRYLDIAANAWSMIVDTHSYAIGGNSQAEHFRQADNITGYLDEDTCETCNTYNMLKLTRELWANSPDPLLFDYYERALLNHLLGVQDPSSPHGHITYFTSLNPGGHRGAGPAWGGGTYSTDYESFWCCQATSLETNTKFSDSIYWHRDSTLYVNLYIPSVLNWADKGVSISQETRFPLSETTELTISGSGSFAVNLRIPEWTAGSARVLVNGEVDDSVSAEPGTYATVDRDWNDADTLTLELPMELRRVPANDDDTIAALAYGPTVLCANYGDETLDAVPPLSFDSVTRLDGDDLAFEATSGDRTVQLGPFYNAHGYNYNVYWDMGA